MAFLSKDVFQSRRKALNALMDANDLDGFILFAADFFQFFSNFHVDVAPWERPIALILPRQREPIAVMNALSTGHLDFAKARGSLWIEQISIYCEFPLDERDERSGKTFVQMLIDAVDSVGLAGGKIGTDSASGWTAKIAEALPNTNFETHVEGARNLRLVKHPEELAIMAAIGRVSDWIQARYVEEIRPGRLVQELDHTIARMTFEKVANEFPGENFELRFYTLSGPSSASPHGDGGQASARIEKGHGLVTIIIPRLNGVTLENERTFFCGEPTEVQRLAYTAALAANEAAIEQMVAGNAVSDIDAAARSVLTEAGFYQNILHRTGHGVGLAGHEFPDDMAFNDRPLLENEVYSAEPGIYLQGVGGFRIDDTVIIGATKPKLLTHAPKSLDSVIISV